jgi:hypothetical protein
MNRFDRNIVNAEIAAISCLALLGLNGIGLAEDEFFPTPPNPLWQTLAGRCHIMNCYLPVTKGLWALAIASRPIGEWFLIRLSITTQPLAAVAWIS